MSSSGSIASVQACTLPSWRKALPCRVADSRCRLAGASGRLSSRAAWRRSSGDVAWSSDRLRHRGLSAPLSLGSTVVFGDAEGWLHLLSRDRGETLLRLPTDGSAIVAPLVRSGLTVLAVTRAGNVFAFRPE